MKEFFLLRYSMKGLTNSERMRFYYSLYGRAKKDKGMVDELSLVKFSREVLICPPSKLEELKQYLESWKITFKVIKIMVDEKSLK